jgi:hypothetical protein
MVLSRLGSIAAVAPFFEVVYVIPPARQFYSRAEI